MRSRLLTCVLVVVSTNWFLFASERTYHIAIREALESTAAPLDSGSAKMFGTNQWRIFDGSCRMNETRIRGFPEKRFEWINVHLNYCTKPGLQLIAQNEGSEVSIQQIHDQIVEPPVRIWLTNLFPTVVAACDGNGHFSRVNGLQANYVFFGDNFIRNAIWMCEIADNALILHTQQDKFRVNLVTLLLPDRLDLHLTPKSGKSSNTMHFAATEILQNHLTQRPHELDSVDELLNVERMNLEAESIIVPSQDRQRIEKLNLILTGAAREHLVTEVHNPRNETRQVLDIDVKRYSLIIRIEGD